MSNVIYMVGKDGDCVVFKVILELNFAQTLGLELNFWANLNKNYSYKSYLNLETQIGVSMCLHNR